MRCTMSCPLDSVKIRSAPTIFYFLHYSSISGLLNKALSMTLPHLPLSDTFANQFLKSCTDHFPLLFCHLWYRNAVRPRICFRTSDVSHFVAAVNIIVTSSPLSPVVSVWIFINFRRAYSFASYGFWCRVQLDPNSIYNSLLLDFIWVEYVTIDNKFVAKGRGQLLEYFFRPPVLRRSGYPETSVNHIAEIEMTFSLYMVKIPSFFRGLWEEL